MNFLKNMHWSIWLLLSLVLMAFLWTQMKSCHVSEWENRKKDEIRAAAAPIDSTELKAREAREKELKLYSTEALAFKDSWKSLGNKLKIRVDTLDLDLPEKGMELKFLEWVSNKNNAIDKNTWFDFDRILFQTGSAVLDTISEEQLNNIAHILNSMPEVEVKIGGYTDNTGDPEANVILSLQRAEAVKRTLIQKGIEEPRLRAEGYGANHPIGDNSTEEGRKRNRRIALRVIKK